MNGQKIREAFIPRSEEFELLAADYSQIELRVIASISKDKNMVDAFIKNQDIHTITAAKIYNVDPDDDCGAPIAGNLEPNCMANDTADLDDDFDGVYETT